LLSNGLEFMSDLGSPSNEVEATTLYEYRVDHYNDGCLMFSGAGPLPPERAKIQLEVRRAGEQRFKVVRLFQGPKRSTHVEP
jgi:hypothetical protein